MVSGMKSHFSLVWNIKLIQLDLKSFLITIFIKTRSKFLMDLINSSNNIKHVLF